MPDQRDTVLVEAARTQRARLGAGLLYGHIGERRTVNDYVRRLIVSIVVAAVACAGCVGVSFVSDLLAKQAATTTSTVAPTTTSGTTVPSQPTTTQGAP